MAGHEQGQLVYLAGPRQVELRSYEVPAPGPGAVVVRVARANVCGSDLHLWKGLHPAVKRGVMGHEMVGRVGRLGPGVVADFAGQPLAVGDRVSCVYFQTCRRCRACVAGQFNLCEQAYRHWVQPPEAPPHFHGTFGTHYYVHPDQHLYRVPDNVPDAIASFANCALAQVCYGLDVAGLASQETLLVQGAGGLGLAAIAVARERGARVIALDGVPDRLEAARAFGAEATIDLRLFPTPQARLERTLELTGGWGADVVAEFTGVPVAFAEGASLARPGGRYLLVGNVSPGQTVPFDPGALTRRQVQILPTIRYQPWYLLRALRLLSATIDRYPWHMLADAEFPLERVVEALERSERREVRRASLLAG